MIFQSNGVIEADVVVLQDPVMKETRGKSDYFIFPPPDQKPRAITHALTELAEVRPIELLKALFGSTKDSLIERQNFVDEWRDIVDCFHLDRSAAFRFSEFAPQIFPHGVTQLAAEIFFEIGEVQFKAGRRHAGDSGESCS